jgi:hypothetical protein
MPGYNGKARASSNGHTRLRESQKTRKNQLIAGQEGRESGAVLTAGGGGMPLPLSPAPAFEKS